MRKIRQKRYTIDSYGQKRELCSCIPIKGAKSIITNPKILLEMDAESIRKSEIQRQNECIYFERGEF